DSGGYNLKPTKYIEDMKCDMAGGATVLGLMHYFAKTKAKKNIVGVVGAVENMVSRDAYRPGDVVKAMNGKTIEIGNTDAEGRLVLADALHYTETKYKPAAIVDFATLTGACMVALGYTMSGIMGRDQKMIEELIKASKQADEEAWQLPLNDYFISKTKGNISDLNNIADGVMAGASMAAAFLSNFVETKKWAHFDIAGTAFNGKNQTGGAKLATGVMLRTIRTWVENQ
ncbi:MAG TPA: M17 family metallopeptidase, partial [Candidatus Gracilibacteria bacterium]